MNKLLKTINKAIPLKMGLFILVFSTMIILTACGGDEDEIEVNGGEKGETNTTAQGEPSFNLLASIVDGESTIGELTSDQQFGTGYIDSVGTDTYDPDNPFKITRDARPIRKIIKQDVYGNVLSDDFYFYRNLLNKSEQRVYDQIYANAVEWDPDLF